MGLLRIFLIFFLIYIVFKTVMKMIFPPAKSDNQFFENTRQKEGEVIVENRSADNKKVSDKEGEYVDYEEVD